MTTGLPLVALYHGKVRTMSGETPAIMESPDYRNVAALDVAEQNGEVDVTPMEVVQMEEVW